MNETLIFEFNEVQTQSSNQLYIFWASESAGPGEEIAIQGHFPLTVELNLLLLGELKFIQLPILSKMPGFIKAQIPDDLPFGVYKIWLQQDEGISKFKFINQALGVCFDSPEIYSEAVMAIKGRNLQFQGKIATVRLVSQNSGVSLLAESIHNGNNRFKLNFRVPSGLTLGDRYNVYISNGYGGIEGETQMDDTLTCIESAIDVFGLGIAWSVNFTNRLINNVYNVKTDERLIIKAVGDGIFNDLPAINAAINVAGAAGGGIVFLPSGKYKCEGSGWSAINMLSNVVLQGADVEQTIIIYGSGTVVSKFIFSNSDQSTIGICNLWIQCQDKTGSFGASLLSGNNVFLKNVRWDIQKGDWIEFINARKVAILDSDIRQENNALIHGPLVISSCDYVTIKRTKFTFVTGGINTTKSSRCFIEDNILIRDVSIPIIHGSIIHLMVCEFTQKSLFSNNKLLLQGGPIPRNPDGSQRLNDGESIISEGGGPNPPDLDYGKVSTATGTTLTDLTKKWPTNLDLKPVVAIIKGRGLGQVRRILFRNNITLNLDTSWDVIPDSTSSYAIFNYGLEDVTFFNNEIRDQQRGITLYHNAMQRVDIVYNRLVNSGSIDITPIQTIRDDTGRHQFTPIYNIEISENDVNGASDLYNGVSIGLQSIQHIIPSSWGTISINMRITKNKLTGAIPNKKVIQDELFSTGYHSYLVFHKLLTNYYDEDVPVILGTIISDNIAIDCEVCITLSTACFQTSISRNKQINSPVLFDNYVLDGTNHGGVGIVTL